MTSNDAPRIETRVAYAGFEEHGFCGHHLYRDLVGEETSTGLLALAVGELRLSDEDRAMLDDLMSVVMVADPRIWPLKIARLVASYGRSYLGYAAGNLALDGALIGVSSCGQVARRLHEVTMATQQGDDLGAATRRSFLAERAVLGFGVPFRPVDERVVALTKCVDRRKFNRRDHWSCFLGVAEVVKAERRLEPNIGVALAAVALDLGFLADRVALLALALASNTFLANVREEAQQRNPVLQTLPVEHLTYTGPPPRISPRGRR